jgi:PAS domain S-box-containing protein
MADLKTILLVEDEFLIAASEAMQLHKAGYEVLLAASGEEAIAQVDRAQPKIDLILMDINLGSGMDGTQAAQEILKTHELPILFLSSHTEPEIVTRTEKITSYGYVVKNSGITVLETSIKMAFKLHAANQAVRFTNEKLSLALEGSRAATWDWDVVRNQFDWSPEFLKLFGMNADQVPSLAAFMHQIHPDDREMVAQQIQDKLNCSGELTVVEYRIVLPDQETRWIQTTGKTYYDGKTPLHMTGLSMDITDRKRAEQAVHESEVKYRTLISEMLPGFSLNELLYAEDGTVSDYITLEVNHAFESYLNVRRADVIGQKASTFLPAEELRHWLAIFGPVVHTRVPSRYELYSPVNGKTFEGLAYAAGKNQFAVTFTDITEIKRSQDALRASEATLRSWLNAIQATAVLLDSAGTILMANAVSAQRMQQRSVDEMIGLNIFELLPPETADVRRQMLEQVLLSGQTLQFEDERAGFTLDNLIYPVFDEDGKIRQIAVLATDITERKQVNMALRESEERFRVIFEDTPDAIFLSDPASGLILDANPAACRLVKRPHAELMGMPLAALSPASRQAQVKDPRTPAPGQAPGSTSALEHVVLNTDGVEIPVEILTRTILWHDQAVLLGIYRDITTRKQAEDQIKQLLLDKELLLREVHHRIKNNMTSISALLSMQADTQNEPTAQKVLYDASARVNSMMVLYDKLYRSIDYNTVALPVFIPALLRELIDLYPHTGTIQIQTDLEEIALPQRILSPLALIVNELTTNAIKYAFLGQQDGLISVSASQNAGRITLTFSDNGVGLPEDINPDNSPGFGMQLVSMLVQQICGTVRIVRQHGTHFVIEFGL